MDAADHERPRGVVSLCGRRPKTSTGQVPVEPWNGDSTCWNRNFWRSFVLLNGPIELADICVAYHALLSRSFIRLLAAGLHTFGSPCRRLQLVYDNLLGLASAGVACS